MNLKNIEQEVILNINRINHLLDIWSKLLIVGEELAQDKVTKSNGSLDGRIKRTTGQPVIFDFETYKKQTRIQAELSTELPLLTDLINSQPAIMDGFSWTKRDFIELYFYHYNMVVQKLKDKVERKQYGRT